MVNLSLYPELKDVDPTLVDGEVIAQVDAERAAMARTQQCVSTIHELYHALEEDNFAEIAFLADDIGCMMKLRETSRGDQGIREFAEYFIRINQADMENISEVIENARRTLKEITGI